MITLTEGISAGKDLRMTLWVVVAYWFILLANNVNMLWSVCGIAYCELEG